MQLTMKIFRGNFWLSDGIVSTISASALAAQLQILADSGEMHSRQILNQALIAVSCYLFSLMLGLLFQKFMAVSSYGWTVLIGSLVFSLITFGRSAVNFRSHMEQTANPVSYGEIVREIIPSFFLVWAIFSLIVAFSILIARILIRSRLAYSEEAGSGR